MRRTLVALALICGLSSQAEAVTLRELVDFTRQGMTDELLIALVEADKSVFHLTAADVSDLKKQGLSDRLLIHLLQTPALRPAPEPRLYMADAKPAPPRVETPAVVVVTNVVQRVEHIEVPVVVRRRVRDEDGRKDTEKEKPAPVYWGYGGKLRPGSWKDR